MSDKPELFALHRKNGEFQISRRDFLKAAAAGAAAVSLTTGNAWAESGLTEDTCGTLPAHKKEIRGLALSPDGKLLVTVDEATIKLWTVGAFEIADRYNASFDGTPEDVFFSPSLAEDKSRVFFVRTDRSIYRYAIDTGIRLMDSWKFETGDVLSDAIALGSRDLLILQNDTLILKKDTETTEYHVKEMRPGGELLTDGTIVYKAGGNGFIYRIAEDYASATDVYRDATYRGVMLPGGTRILAALSGDEFKLVDVISGELVWDKYHHGFFSGKKTGFEMAVSPDGSLCFLHGAPDHILVMDMADGSKKGEIPFEPSTGVPLCVTPDGRKLIAAAGSLIRVWSLPDGELLTCPLDLDAMQTDEKGVKITTTDPISGESVTYVRPCGSPIPAGAVCTCNCVAGTVRPPCGCVGDTCGCVGNTCSCQSNRSVPGSHYWHPN